MAEPRGFFPVKLVCGIIAAGDGRFEAAENRLTAAFGGIDGRGPRVPFAGTAYYEPEMGPDLRRGFISFRTLVSPERLAEIKILTNALEVEFRAADPGGRRVVNLDPGYLTRAALVLATAKDFAHRIPLRDGIYAHLECLFTKNGIRLLDWTYPDLRTDDHAGFFLSARKAYLEALRPD